MGGRGREPAALTRSRTPISENPRQSGTESGTLKDDSALLDPDLARLIEEWPELPAGVREEILRLAGLPRERE